MILSTDNRYPPTFGTAYLANANSEKIGNLVLFKLDSEAELRVIIIIRHHASGVVKSLLRRVF